MQTSRSDSSVALAIILIFSPSFSSEHTLFLFTSWLCQIWLLPRIWLFSSDRPPFLYTGSLFLIWASLYGHSFQAKHHSSHSVEFLSSCVSAALLLTISSAGTCDPVSLLSTLLFSCTNTTAPPNHLQLISCQLILPTFLWTFCPIFPPPIILFLKQHIACRLDGEQKSLARPPRKYPNLFLNLLIASLFIFASSVFQFLWLMHLVFLL